MFIRCDREIGSKHRNNLHSPFHVRPCGEVLFEGAEVSRHVDV